MHITFVQHAKDDVDGEERREDQPRLAVERRLERGRAVPWKVPRIDSGTPKKIFADELRVGTEALLRKLKALGVERIVIATGDRREVAEMVSKGLPIDAVRSELSPDQKTLVVLSERKNGPVMMIGDGVNDAPALAAADLGVAMGAKGAAASAEGADVVLLVDQLDRILPAIKIARRARSIALESVFSGMGLSIAGMIAAALGFITPVQGAILQEMIDVAVILNSLRALYDPAALRAIAPYAGRGYTPSVLSD